MAQRFELLKTLMCEFAIEFDRSLAINVMRLFSGIEDAEVFTCYVGSPSIDRPVIKSSYKTGCVLTGDSDISCVFLSSSRSKIVPSVVGGDAVDVVDFSFWPFSGHPQPSEAMGVEFAVGYTGSVEGDYDGRIVILATERMDGSYLPRSCPELAGIGVVIEPGTQFVSGQIVSECSVHGVVGIAYANHERQGT